MDNTGALARLFRQDLPSQLRALEIRRAMGQTAGLTCLDVSLSGPLISRNLRSAGGSWTSLLPAGSLGWADGVLEEGSYQAFDAANLPFEDKSFDVIVLSDVLEKTGDDVGVIRECHRLLSNDGRMVLHVRNAKRFTLLDPLRRVLRLTPERQGWARSGYSEKVLFNVLKSGFDVVGLRTHTRFFLEAVDTFVRAAVGQAPWERDLAKTASVYAAAGPMYRVAFQLDTIFFLTRGFYLVAVARRRLWRSRQAPVLSDGRTITEAVLSRAPHV